MRILGSARITAAAVWCMALAPAFATNDVVYVISVKEEITRSTVFLIRRGLNEAASAGARAVVVDMDTNGGSVDATEKIIQLLQHARSTTYTFVNVKAYSAGAYIASATDHIYMAPGSVMGAATPVMLIPGSGIQELPKSYEEKITSALRALIRSTAQEKGHNPAVFEAMVDADVELVVDGHEISPKGKLLTLTNEEAAREFGDPPKPLLSAGTVKDLPSLLEKIGLDGASVVEVKPYGFEVLARWITLFSPLLIAVGLVAIWVELKTPGLGVPSVVAAICFGLFFIGYVAAGLAGWEEPALFIVGLTLLALEIFVIPGFGITGVAGILAITTALLMAMVERWPGYTFPTLPQWQDAVIRLGWGLGGALAIGFVLVRWLPKTSVFQRLELGQTLSTAEGYTSSASEAMSLLGATGVAETVLRPAGKGRFGETLVDVVTEGDFIERGEPITIIAVEGSRVLVNKWISKSS